MGTAFSGCVDAVGGVVEWGTGELRLELWRERLGEEHVDVMAPFYVAEGGEGRALVWGLRDVDVGREETVGDGAFCGGGALGEVGEEGVH